MSNNENVMCLVQMKAEVLWMRTALATFCMFKQKIEYKDRG